MLKLIMCFLIFVFYPTIIGLGLLSFCNKSRKSITLGIITGMIIEFAIFQLLSIPMRLNGYSTLISLRNMWIAIICILSVVFLCRVPNYYKEIIKEIKKNIIEVPKSITLILIILIGFQCYMSFKYMHEDGDDATFVSSSVTALDRNSLKQYAGTGIELTEYSTRNLLSPYYFYIATIASLTQIHPTIIAHTVFPVIFIIYAYFVYYLLGTALFDDKNKTMIFLLIIGFLITWGDYSRYSLPLRLILRVWQGKSVLVTIIVPFIWYLYIEYLCKEQDNFYWGILFFTSLASVLTSSMSFALIPMEILTLSLLYCIKDKNINYIIKAIIAILPIVAYGIVYLFVK